MTGCTMRAAAALVLAAGLAFAADDTIREIQVKATGAFAADTGDVLALCSAKVGDRINQAVISRDERALKDTQRFTAVSIEQVPLADGVRLVYVVIRRYRFTGPVEITGVDYFSRGKVEDWLALVEGAPVDDQVVAVKCNRVRDEYRKRYFPQAVVKAEVVPTAPQGSLARVRVRVTEGRRVKPGDYVFRGNRALTAVALRATFGERAWWDPRGWFTTRPYDEQQLDDARQQALDAYLDAGYLDAKVSAGRFEPAGPRRANVVFDVTEGSRYIVSSVVVQGMKTFPEREVAASLALVRVGQPASRRTVQEAARGIRDYYGARGYVDAVVRQNIVPDGAEGSRATVRFDVQEGSLVRVHNVVIRGNERTRDKVIRREVPVSPGAVMDEVRIARSENRLRNMGLFENVRHYTAPGDADNNRDLVYEVTEGRTGNFMIGGGFSSVDKLVGYVQVQQGNFDLLNWPTFTGGGQKAKLAVEVGSNHQAYEINWVEPWFLDKPMALSVDLFRRSRDFDEYEMARTGGSVGLSYPVSVGNLSFKWTLEQVTLDNLLKSDFFYVDGGDPYLFTDEPDVALNSVLDLSWNYDTRDRFFVPTRGTQASLFGAVAGTMLGGENDFYRFGASYRRWVPLWWKHVLSLRGRVETIEGYGDTAVPIYERLFLGGGRTVRGIAYRELGPKVDDGSGGDVHPVGGQSLALLSAEYTVPVFEAVRLAVFTDAGAVSRDAFDFSGMQNSYAVTAGLGVRIDIPGFPIRFDYAVPVVNKDDLAQEERFVFWIGFE